MSHIEGVGFDTGRFAGVNLEQRSEMPLTAGMLVVLTGPSAVGKTKVADLLIEKDPSFARLVTLTTRPPDESEVDGVDYHFVTDEQLEREYSMGNLVERVGYVGHQYALPKSGMDELLNGKNLVSVMEVSGAAKIKENIQKAYSPDMAKAILERTMVFVLGINKEEDLRKRAQIRGRMGLEDIEKRMVKDQQLWDQHYQQFDTVIYNNNGQANFVVDTIKWLLSEKKAQLALS